MAQGFSEKKKRLIKEYPKDLNGQKAAERAGYAKSTARAVASRILATPEAQAEIKADLDAYLKEIGVDNKRVMLEYARIAFVNLADAYDERGELLNIKQMPEDVQRSLVGIETHKDFTEGVEVGETKRVRLHDKMAALNKFWAYFELLKPLEVKHSGTLTLEDLLIQSNEPEDG